MKKTSTILAAVVASVAFVSAANATTWYGTGSNFGGGWNMIGNQIYGTGSNFGSGYSIIGNQIYGTGNLFGSAIQSLTE